MTEQQEMYEYQIFTTKETYKVIGRPRPHYDKYGVLFWDITGNQHSAFVPYTSLCCIKLIHRIKTNDN